MADRGALYRASARSIEGLPMEQVKRLTETPPRFLIPLPAEARKTFVEEIEDGGSPAAWGAIQHATAINRTAMPSTHVCQRSLMDGVPAGCLLPISIAQIGSRKQEKRPVTRGQPTSHPIASCVVTRSCGGVAAGLQRRGRERPSKQAQEQPYPRCAYPGSIRRRRRPSR